MKIDETEKQLHLQMWKESGLSKIAFARQIGLNPYTFYSWFYAQKKKQEKTKTTFVEVMTTPELRARSREHNSKSIGITLGNGYNLVVSAGTVSPTCGSYRAGLRKHRLFAIFITLHGRRKSW